ncbi:hypothetical protein KGF56_003973 [Candida oxycetoniae]|uniref:WSC domain-containing protein n=1 Tax=Candida oxycetoniae TaxID=497107 RepID=A0AAI9SUC5_9ASCO|nr:uncharacterized protein KGF56_003973 [Candida oxycetoniae]KAI3403238.2 hypothetical protein KGF56_003973 [Candida oxycetoniae]
MNVPVLLHKILLILSFTLKAAQCLTLSYCSKQNLAANSQISDEFMSNGLCKNKCGNSGYAVAILSHFDCFCSNEVPGDTVDMSNCEVGCPGYKDQESCAGNGYYGYLVIGTPSATIGETATTNRGSGSSSSSSSSDSDSDTEETSEDETTSTTEKGTALATKPTTDSTTTSLPPTTLVTQTTQVIELHSSKDVIKVTRYLTVTASTSTRSTSSSSPTSASTIILVSTHIEPSTVYSIMTINGTQTQQVRTMYITQYPSLTTNSFSSSNTAPASSISSSSSSSPSSPSLPVSSLSGFISSSETLLDSASSNPIGESIQSSSSLISAEASETPGALNEHSDDNGSSPNNKNTFFSSTGKVAGTFTAVGVVVFGIVSAILYCCCCLGGAARRKSDDSENDYQYSSDELSLDHEEKTIVRPPTVELSKHSSFSILKSDNSNKSLVSYITRGSKENHHHPHQHHYNHYYPYANNKHTGPTGTTGGAGINRNSSRKKLMSRRNSFKDTSSNGHSPNHQDGLDQGVMFPIDELDNRLDPDTMFLPRTNSSIRSLGDDYDYSRKLKITNPDVFG